MRRRAASFLALLASAGLFVALPASPAAAKKTGLELLGPTVPSMLPGQQGWVGVTWIATDDVCDVEVTASGAGVTVAYPTSTKTYSSLYQNSSMLEGGIDFTAFQLTLSPTAAGTITLNLSVSYRVVPGGHSGDAAWCKGASRTTAAEAVTMDVKRYSGPAFTQNTAKVAVAQNTPAWVKVAFTGYLPGQTGFALAVKPPAGLVVTYPAGATSAGLNSASTLPVGYEDYASVFVDATSLKPGTYTLPLTLTSGKGSTTGSLVLTVS